MSTSPSSDLAGLQPAQPSGRDFVDHASQQEWQTLAI
jgi:hypothetical protein